MPGETSTRPGLDHHTRSMITIAMLIALNREAELKDASARVV